MASHNRKNGMLTTIDVAHLLNTHVNTVRRWSDQRLLKVYRIGPRVVSDPLAPLTGQPAIRRRDPPRPLRVLSERRV